VEVSKKIVLDTEKGALLHIIVQYPLPAPLYCLQYCAIYFPHDPLYCNKILAISCKGQGPSPAPSRASSASPPPPRRVPRVRFNPHRLFVLTHSLQYSYIITVTLLALAVAANGTTPSSRGSVPYYTLIPSRIGYRVYK